MAATRWRDSAIGARRVKKCILVDVNGLVECIWEGE